MDTKTELLCTVYTKTGLLCTVDTKTGLLCTVDNKTGLLCIVDTNTGICFSLSAPTLDYLYVQCNNKDSFWQCTKTGLFTGVNTVTELCLVSLYTQCGISIRGKWEQKAQLSARQLHPPTHHCYINKYIKAGGGEIQRWESLF